MMISVPEIKGIAANKSSMLAIKNANYEKVLSAIDKLIHERYHRVCSCERCVSDVAALALNYLPPHYYVDADQSKGYGSPWVMIENAVQEAIDQVIEKPRHACKREPSNMLHRP